MDAQQGATQRQQGIEIGELLTDMRWLKAAIEDMKKVQAERHAENKVEFREVRAHVDNVEHSVKNIRQTITEVSTRVVAVEKATAEMAPSVKTFDEYSRRSKWLMGIGVAMFAAVAATIHFSDALLDLLRRFFAGGSK
jgi:predicted  nucleic acid-binding Zn-ribbon protein